MASGSEWIIHLKDFKKAIGAGIRTDKWLGGSQSHMIIHKQLHPGYLTASCRNCLLLFGTSWHGPCKLSWWFWGTMLFLSIQPALALLFTTSWISHLPHLSPLGFYVSLYHITLTVLQYWLLYYTPLQSL